MFSLKKAGFIPISVGYSEIKNSAKIISELNFNGDINYGDCTKINPNDLEDFDLLTAGFPCQDVSVDGKNDLSSGRTILFNEIIRIAEVKKPEYLLLENVKGLLQKKHANFFVYIKNELKRIGYHFHYKVLNSKHYGIPQNRERIFFVCFRAYNKYKEFIWPMEEDLLLKVEDIIIKDTLRIKSNNKRLDRILSSPTGKLNPMFELKGDTPSGISRQSDRIYTTISPCLNCTQKDNKFFINNEVISLTGLEHMRLMGFLNDEIKLTGLSENQIKDLAGDGWDMNLVSKIFKEMFK
jgi:DNA (cytosine-5)-methyltransferase 1